MVDYSKWDNLDVSDDSDVEPSTQPKQAQQQQPATTSASSSQALTTTTTRTHSDPPTSEEEPSRLSPALQHFANIPPSNYKASQEFLFVHPDLIAKSSNSDGLLMKEGFIMALELEDSDFDTSSTQTQEEKDEIVALVRQCIHQALLIQYCRLVSPDGTDREAVAGFFMRLMMAEVEDKDKGGDDGQRGRQREMFEGDVETRTGEIRELAKEARAEQLRGLKEGGKE